MNNDNSLYPVCLIALFVIFSMPVFLPSSDIISCINEVTQTMEKIFAWANQNIIIVVKTISGSVALYLMYILYKIMPKQ